MNQRKYDTIKGQLLVDAMRLTEDLIQLPSLQQEAAEEATRSQHRRDIAKDQVDLARSEAAAALRLFDVEQASTRSSYKLRSETQITSEVLLDGGVRDALAELRDAEQEMQLWRSLADGMRSKSSSIQTIAELIRAGYTSPQSIYDQRREEIGQRRRQLNRGT